jgi:hypothetical protein
MFVVVVISQHLLNVFVQLANKRGFNKKKIFACRVRSDLQMATGTQFYLENDGQSPLTLIIICQEMGFEILRAVVKKLCSL